MIVLERETTDGGTTGMTGKIKNDDAITHTSGREAECTDHNRFCVSGNGTGAAGNGEVVPSTGIMTEVVARGSPLPGTTSTHSRNA